MKRITLISLAALTMAACTSNQSGQSRQTTQSDSLFQAPAETVVAEAAEPKEAAAVIEIKSDEEFRRLIYDYKASPDEFRYAGSLPAVIDLYATWCGPCRQLAPHMQKVAQEMSGRVIFYKVDVDQCAETAEALNVQSIPMVIYAQLGDRSAEEIGYIDEEELRTNVERILLQ